MPTTRILIHHEACLTILRHLVDMTNRRINICGAEFKPDPTGEPHYNYRWCAACLGKAKR